MSGAVFDCDGLLVNTEALWWAAYEATAASLGGSLSDAERAAFSGASVGTAARRLGQLLERPISPARLSELLVEGFRAAAIEPMAGAHELLEILAERMPIAVATNAPAAIADLALRGAGLRELVGDLISAEGPLAPKPAPDVYLHACERLGVSPDAAIAFEDSPPGARSARAAGLWVIGVNSTPVALEADMRVARLDDADVLKRLGLV